MNTASQERLKLVYPGLEQRIYQLSTRMLAQGVPITVTQGLRTVDEQHALYAQGRTTPGKIVTNADGGHSWHNFGLAVDCAPVEKDGSIDWNAGHPQWKLMERTGVELGLTSGANWLRLQDAPHFQITGRFPVGAPDEEVRRLYLQGGLLAVWAAVEVHSAISNQQSAKPPKKL